MYHYSSYRRPRTKGSYFLPFFSLIAIVLIGVFLFQIIGYFRAKRAAALQNKAAVTLVAGRAQMKIWGLKDWTDAGNGNTLNEGDSIRVGPASRAILTLLNGSVIRLDADTEIEFSALKSKDGHDEAAMTLKTGQVWLKRTQEPLVKAAFTVSTDHLKANSLGTIFAVSHMKEEAVRVLEGKVMVDVSVPENADTGARMRVAESIEVVFGQELSLRAPDIVAIQNQKTVPLLALLSDQFHASEWYQWNRAQDREEGLLVTVADAVLHPSENPPPPGPAPLAAPPPPPEVVPVLLAPVILLPQPADRTTKSETVYVSGTVSSVTQKIEVTTFIRGKPESYLLQKYRPGSGKWSYVVSRTYANFLPGDNRFSFVAIDKDGLRSVPAELVLTFDSILEPAELSAPKVVRFNGQSAAETTEDSVRVEGTVGRGLFKVIVNGFALGQYVPGSTAWVYYAKTAYGNLKDGENSYEVYGEDATGKKTPVTKFVIMKIVK